MLSLSCFPIMLLLALVKLKFASVKPRLNQIDHVI